MKNQNFHSRYVRNFIYVHIPNVKTVVIVYITENKKIKLTFEEIFLETNVFKSRVNFEN